MDRLAKLFLLLICLALIACGSDDDDGSTGVDSCDIPLDAIAYNPELYSLVKPNVGFQEILQPEYNKATLDGVALGRKLFYDPILSKDGTMSCASCHLPEMSFSDGLAVSVGEQGLSGDRSSMSLMNIVYSEPGLFWDGRSVSLEDQALDPVEDPLELNHNWADIESTLSCDTLYAQDFRKAFGINSSAEITRELVTFALAQFERSLLGGNSRYDQIVYELADWFTDDEQNGNDMYFDVFPDIMPDAECAHCHAPPTFSGHEFLNNGLDSAANLFAFADLGRGAVTGDSLDNGKFIAPTLRNIALTAPYMHDGRFQTLEEVIEHYNSGGHGSPNRDPLIRPLGLNDQQKKELLAFLHTLTDTTFINNPAYQSPF